MNKYYFKISRLALTICFFCLSSYSAFAQRIETYLHDNWKFTLSDDSNYSKVELDDSNWEDVTVPHDWAINGPFDKEIDKQVVAIEQNGEKEATEKTGRSGSLPWIGSGWYRTHFFVDASSERVVLNFDGAMSEPDVYVNGQLAGSWKYGYTPFNIDITQYIINGGDNTLAVRLQNIDESSRWYPGAGLYRPVKLIQTKAVCVKEWGVNVITESLDPSTKSAEVRVNVDIVGLTSNNNVYLQLSSNVGINERCQVSGPTFSKAFILNDLTFWSPETPELYDLHVQLLNSDGTILDTKNVKYGVRTIEVSESKGFALNGVSRKIKGVCLHHDLGMLGAAINKAALLHQLVLLKSMGCDAIRTSHNMPSQWQMELCDSLGMMVMAESFDMWIYPKCKNGYSRFFKDWSDKDLKNLVLSNRLHPSIVMWSIGNEIPEQGMKEGNSITRHLQDVVHSLDRTRPVTSGLDRIDNALATGFAQVLDIPGMNYRTQKYEMAHEKLRHGFLLGSETASTISSRGVYKFPVKLYKSHAYDDGQCSGYDVECCSWSNLPEEDWVLQDDKDWVIGEFVWTGFDYLGEPTPYDEYWPSRSSYFGIFDLAGLPKDRYYLYRSKWNTNEPTIHLLPHWTWPDRVGKVTPVYCYTNYPTAELFVNGKSQGKISKKMTNEINFINNEDLLDRYRLRWNNVVYEPGELKVVVYDKSGYKAGEKTIHTAGKAYRLNATVDRTRLHADGEDMAFITVEILDKDGHLCPDADNQINVEVKGCGNFKGICNGDATSIEVFTHPTMKAFKGMLSVGIQTTREGGQIKVVITSPGLKKTEMILTAE